ncbi:MAG: hypothetical protein IKZ61_04695 [Prevotella sp.]|nr:hypothetical protein [Prevotella sp.]
MKTKHFIIIACAAMTVCLCSSCNPKEMLRKWLYEKEETTGEATKDSIWDVKVVKNTEVENTQNDAVTDEEAIAFIEEFYAMDGWEVSDLEKYLSPEVLKELELDPDDDNFRDVAIGEKYRGWDLVCGDPVGDTDLLNTTKAKAIGNNQYEKVFTTAHWMNHSRKYNTTYRYSVGRINGQLKITKVENGD